MTPAMSDTIPLNEKALDAARDLVEANIVSGDIDDETALVTVPGLIGDVAALSQPQAGEPVPAGYRYRHSEQENWHYGPSANGWWECQPLYASPQPALAVKATDEQIIELAVTHSNYREGVDFEVISHARIVEFARHLLSLVASPPPSGEVEALAEFGLGNIGVDTGTAHGKPAVFIRPLDHFGPVGDRLPDAKQIKGPQPSLEPGEFYLTFPTMEQAEQVATALSSAPATAEGWRTMDSPVPTYECDFRVGQPVKMAAPYAEDDPNRVFYVTGIRWEYRMVIGHGWDITIASKGEIEKRHGATDGFAPSDLLPAAPTATGGQG